MRRLLQFTSLRLHPHRTYSNPQCSSSLAIAIPGSLDKWWRRSSDELRLLTRVVERRAVQALSAQHMFRVVNHLAAESGSLASEIRYARSLYGLFNPKKLNFHFWSLDTNYGLQERTYKALSHFSSCCRSTTHLHRVLVGIHVCSTIEILDFADL